MQRTDCPKIVLPTPLEVQLKVDISAICASVINTSFLSCSCLVAIWPFVLFRIKHFHSKEEETSKQKFFVCVLLIMNNFYSILNVIFQPKFCFWPSEVAPIVLIAQVLHVSEFIKISEHIQNIWLISLMLVQFECSMCPATWWFGVSMVFISFHNCPALILCCDGWKGSGWYNDHLSGGNFVTNHNTGDWLI